MKEAAIPSWALGYATKILAWDEAEGEGSRVAKLAYQLSIKRQAKGLPGTPEDDWKEAEKVVTRRFAKEVLEKLA